VFNEILLLTSHFKHLVYDCSALSHWLSPFVSEVRNTDGSFCPLKLYISFCVVLHVT